MHQFPKGPEDLLLPPVEQGEAPTVQSFHGKVLRHSFRAFIAKSSVEQGKAPTAEVTSCELRKKVGIYLCVYIHVNIIVKVEYSSRERSGLGATMAHQLKVERSKPCRQKPQMREKPHHATAHHTTTTEGGRKPYHPLRGGWGTGEILSYIDTVISQYQ